MSSVWPELSEVLHPRDCPSPASWRPCYETKFAIARLLQPQSIFEIGVRTGYSAFAFLKASPKARYVGIDANVDCHGGFRGAIDHARRLLGPYRAEVLELTSEQYAANRERPPMAFYDLIHVDGDHSTAGCLFDLRFAMRLGFRHLLVDDYYGLAEVRVAVN